MYFITSIVFITINCLLLHGLQYDISGLSKKWITLSLNSAEMTGCPSSKEIFFLAELNTLDFVFGDNCDTRHDKICAFFWGLFGRALVALAVALPSACFLEKELVIANGDEWLGDDIADVELAVTDFFFSFFHSIFCFVVFIFCSFLQSFSLDSFSVSILFQIHFRNFFLNVFYILFDVAHVIFPLMKSIKKQIYILGCC